jgi:hypothetical protein
MKQDLNEIEFFPYRGERRKEQRNVIKILLYTGPKNILQKHFSETYVHGAAEIDYLKIKEIIISQDINLHSCRRISSDEFEKPSTSNLHDGSVVRILRYTGATHNLNPHLQQTKNGICVFEMDKNGSNIIVKIKNIWDERFLPTESLPYRNDILKYLSGIQKNEPIAQK